MKMQLPIYKQRTRAPPYWSRSLSAMKEKEGRKEGRDSQEGPGGPRGRESGGGYGQLWVS